MSLKTQRPLRTYIESSRSIHPNFRDDHPKWNLHSTLARGFLDTCSFTIIIPSLRLLFMQFTCLECSTHFFSEIYRIPTDHLANGPTPLGRLPSLPVIQDLWFCRTLTLHRTKKLFISLFSLCIYVLFHDLFHQVISQPEPGGVFHSTKKWRK